jgi:hypothetical protein
MEGIGDHHEHAIEVVLDVVVPETKHAIPQPGEISIAASVFAKIGVAVTIGLDDQSLAVTDEIDDVSRYRLLAPEPESELGAPKLAPQDDLGWCRIGTVGSCVILK